jgi:beta-galactosidase
MFIPLERGMTEDLGKLYGSNVVECHLPNKSVAPAVIITEFSLTWCRCSRDVEIRLVKNTLFVCAVALLSAATLTAQTYVPPANERADILLNSGWQFIRQDVAGAQDTNFDDSAWTNASLPHTWNNLDGQDGGNNYYRGVGWYRKHFTVDGGYINRRFFLKFDGAFSVADVYVNGNHLGQHQGGFAAFVFDATPYLNVGNDNVIAVKVNNAFNTNIPPLTADFTFFGGLYRGVHLLVTDPVHISPLDFGSPGVYLKTTHVSSNSADLQITAVISNASAQAQSVSVRAVVTDAMTNIVTTLTNVATLPAGSSSNVVLSTVIGNPHLWDGLSDPYLYQTFVELWNGADVVDVVAQPIGFRWFSVDPTNGFFLNGRHYDLHGVSMHQDWLNRGWAIGDAERRTNFMLLKEMGATALRLSHYQHAEETYQLADQNGIVLWSEIPLINYITEAPAFYASAKQQMTELIRQKYNHPAIVCWGVFNEITLSSGPIATNLVSQLVQLVAQEDSTRPSVAAANSSDGDATTRYSQLLAFNKYFGWYNGAVSGLAAWADNIHANYPARCIGVSEYGAGASIRQHSENPTQPSTGGSFHPEEYQNLYHEIQWQQMKARPFLWCKFVWNMCDFAADARSEGDTAGRNDKGLITYDRQVRKDAFYWYKANWATDPMVYITGHTFTNRAINTITAKVYANCDSVELFLNGVSQGSRTSTNCIFTWVVSLRRGTNSVEVVGTRGASNVTDSLIWIAPVPPPNASITSPSATIVYLTSTNDTLQLSATASDDLVDPPVPLTTTWTQLSGSGVVTFANSSALNTTARFSADGLYGLSFNANNGTATNSIGLSVVVKPASGVQNGLLAWWKMDEAGGSTATDSSANGRAATVNGAVFSSGYQSNALYLNGLKNVATFASPDSGQITIAAWVRADAFGNSAYPRVIETPGYRLFFRFDGQGTNGFDFATFHSSQNGDWFSGQSTVSLGAWYHVAACYDRNNLANVPAMYVNGVKVSPRTITSPSGTLPAFTGTGNIGNNAALSRAWNGGIDDLRVYNRILTDTEVQVLASTSPPNVAPAVNAGTNQTLYLPAPAVLDGAVLDDGKPDPPGLVTATWSKVSGPGDVTFADSNSPATTVAFSNGGTYSLRLVADDGEVRTSHDVTLSAVAPPVISLLLLSGAFRLSWPTGGNWLLQHQTNPPLMGLGSNWLPVAGPVTNPFVAPIDPGVGSAFYRLILTN